MARGGTADALPVAALARGATPPIRAPRGREGSRGMAGSSAVRALRGREGSRG
jgi:hypothetical protein